MEPKVTVTIPLRRKRIRGRKSTTAPGASTLTFKCGKDDLQLIVDAAKLCRVTRSTFIRQAAVNIAKSILEEEEDGVRPNTTEGY